MAALSDSRFCPYLHRNHVLDVVDDEWRRETLPDEDIEMPSEVEIPCADSDDARGLGLPHQKLEDKWTELGLDDLQDA